MLWESYSITGESFHFGRHGTGQEETSVTFPSDSLFAAMIYCASLIEEEETFNARINAFQNGNPPFILTTAFPRAGNIRFFPKPMLHWKNRAAGASLKQIKKLAFISEDLFQRLLQGESLDKLFLEGKILQGGHVLISASEFDQLPVAVRKNGSLWEILKRPRVTLDREKAASAIYFTAVVQFNEGCGLWFGLHNRSNHPVEHILTELSVQGLGGERSVGVGNCHIEPFGKIELPDVNSSNWITLSRYIPTEDESPNLFNENAAYTIETVAGWLNAPGKKAERRKPLI